MATRVLHSRGGRANARRNADVHGGGSGRGRAWLTGRVVVACALGIACGAASCQEAVDPPASPPPSTRTATFAAPDAMLQAALDDAAQRTTIAREALSVISADAVTWRDGSLGCPQPGMMYTQALVPGYRIVIQAGDRQMRYHASQRGRPVFCPENRAVDPAPGEQK